METKTDYQRFNLRLPIDLHRRIKAQAEADRRSITQTMILALEDWLKKSQVAETRQSIEDWHSPK